MKLLFVLPRVPFPLEKGDKLRAFHQLRHLAKRHEITLFALSDQPIDPSATHILEEFCTSVEIHPLSRPQVLFNLLRSIFNGLPFQVGYFLDNAARRHLDRVVRENKPDHIYCQLIRTAEYARPYPDIPHTLDFMDVFSKGIERRMRTDPWWMKPILWWEHRKLVRFERRAFDMFDQSTIITAQDRDLIPHPDRKAIHVVPNGVDMDFFQPRSGGATVDLLFNGNMNYPPNIESVQYLVHKVMPLVWRARPETTLLISGANPHPTVRRLASARVEVSGWVDDVRDSYASARILVAPMQISIGLQNKLLEGMAMGLPCITSPLANNALGATPGSEVLIASDPEEYATHMLALLEDESARSMLAANGREFVRRSYSWERTALQLEEIFAMPRAPKAGRTG